MKFIAVMMVIFIVISGEVIFEAGGRSQFLLKACRYKEGKKLRVFFDCHKN